MDDAHHPAPPAHPLAERADRRQRGHPDRAEVFGAAFAGSWAIANLLALGTLGARILDGLFVLCGIVVMVQFVRAAQRVEPFTAD